jgi:hypothetical protein
MEKLQPTGQNLGQVFNCRTGNLHAAHLWCYQVKLPNLKLKTWPIQLVGSLLLDIVLPRLAYQVATVIGRKLTKKSLILSVDATIHVQ